MDGIANIVGGEGIAREESDVSELLIAAIRPRRVGGRGHTRRVQRSIKEKLIREANYAIQLFIIAALLAGCATAPDSIDRLVSRLSSDHAWEAGSYFTLDLPPTSSIEEVVAKVLQRSDSDGKTVTMHKILKIRQVSIPGSLPSIYTAVLVDTDLGRKVVLLNHVGPDHDWWYRVFHEWWWAAVPQKAAK